MKWTILALCIATSCLGQGPPKSPSFEVVSIKRAAPAGGRVPYLTGGPGSNSPGQLVWKNVTVRPIILRAFGIKSYQLFGPAALDSGPVDIVAKVPSGAGAEAFSLMLQDLLVRRFGLVFRRETRQLPIYELVVAKGGVKLKAPAQKAAGSSAPKQTGPAPDGSRNNPLRIQLDKDGMLSLPPGIPNISSFGLNGIIFVSARMKTVGDLLCAVDSHIDRVVVDKSELTGLYDYAARFIQEPAGGPTSVGAQSGQKDLAPPPPGSEIPGIREAFERQLGLKLEDRAGAVQVVVVERVNAGPSEN